MNSLIPFPRRLSTFLNNIFFDFKIPDFWEKYRKNFLSYNKYLEKPPLYNDKVKEIPIKPRKELRLYLEEEDLSLLSELNFSSNSFISNDLSYTFDILSYIYFSAFLAIFLVPFLNDCVLDSKESNSMMFCYYNSIMKSPINHSLFFKVVFFLFLKFLLS